ncbi:uncharacterized protein LOC128216331 [Mya arenaria]|uniref:uncharacterized protein LOC128216331 n=1 Tax=Mya arenaria TaxID=6604 RepID=UPI0022E5B65D|nr:uncharacterized protein LOC128216331 [Mya arenaria]
MICYIVSLQNVLCVNYLDDFGGADVPSRAHHSFRALSDTLHRVGVQENVKKASEPSPIMVFLGVLLDSDRLELRITPERLEEIRSLLSRWMKKRSASKRDLQSLLGKLQFIGKCVKPSRVFISRILVLLRGLKNNDQKVKLGNEFRKDIKWWISFVHIYNGVSMMKTSQWSTVDQVFSSDACLSGCGAINQCGEFFHKTFPKCVLEACSNIAQFECISVVVALKLWSVKWQGLKISIFCDNQAVCSVLNSGRTKDPILQKCLREVAYLACSREFELRAVHLSSASNRLADLLSRWHLDRSYAELFAHEALLNGYTEINVDDSMFILEND